MRYNEPTAALRRIPVYLVDDAGLPLTGAAPVGAEIRVSKSGAGFGVAAGTWSELGSGLYTYEAMQAETETLSFLLLCVTLTGVRPYVYAEDIGDRIAADATGPARRLPIYLVDAVAGDPVTGLTLSGAELQLVLNGAALATATGTATEIGSGAYYYELAEPELVEGYGALRVSDAAAQVYVYTWNVRPADAPLAEESEPIPASLTLGTQAPTIDFVARALARLPSQYRGTDG